MTTVFEKVMTGYRFVDTRVGDTLQRIAARELGDAAQWPLLISFNKLVPPYITDDPSLGGPNIIVTGQQILVPATAPVIESTVDPNLVFDIDIALVNGRIQADTDEIALVKGRDNLKQALANRVVTDRGELLFHSEYGSYIREMLGAANGPTAELLAAQYAAAAVLTDLRVARVTRSTASIVGDKINVVVEVEPIIGRPVQISVTL